MSGFKKFILTFCLLQLRLNALIVDDTTQLFVCSPGETINHSITLSNAYDEEKKYHLSQADYSFSADGTSQFSPPQTLERSNAGWINLQTPYVTIPAEGEATIYYTISVPNNSELKGSYWSLFFIEPEEGIDSSAPDDAWAIQTKIRYAYLMITTIGKGEADIRLLKAEIETINDKLFISIDLENCGDFFIWPDANLKMFNTEGILVKESQLEHVKILPNTSIRYLIPATDLAGGTYKYFLILHEKNGSYFGERFQLTIPQPEQQQ